MNNPKNYVEQKLGVLSHLRDLFHQRARTREQLPLELTLVAADLGISIEDVQGTIAELIALDLVKPLDPNTAHLAVTQGECEITTNGLFFLHNYETSQHIRPLNTEWGRAGFGSASP
jgi:hypothetical protein